MGPALRGFAPAVFFPSCRHGASATGLCTRYRVPLVGQRLAAKIVMITGVRADATCTDPMNSRAISLRRRRPKMEDRAEEHHCSLAYGKHGKYSFFQGRGRYGNCRPCVQARKSGGYNVISFCKAGDKAHPSQSGMFKGATAVL